MHNPITPEKNTLSNIYFLVQTPSSSSQKLPINLLLTLRMLSPTPASAFYFLQSLYPTNHLSRCKNQIFISCSSRLQVISSFCLSHVLYTSAEGPIWPLNSVWQDLATYLNIIAIWCMRKWKPLGRNKRWNVSSCHTSECEFSARLTLLARLILACSPRFQL